MVGSISYQPIRSSTSKITATCITTGEQSRIRIRRNLRRKFWDGFLAQPQGSRPLFVFKKNKKCVQKWCSTKINDLRLFFLHFVNVDGLGFFSHLREKRDANKWRNKGIKIYHLRGIRLYLLDPEKTRHGKMRVFTAKKMCFFFTPQKENAVGSQPSTRRLDSGWFFMAGQPNPHPPRKK